MKYSFINPIIDAQISEIRKVIRLSMNGIVSENMTRNGIVYKANFGVSIPRIKEIAAGYTPNHELAQQLWKLQIRETMIMATLLEPIDKFSFEIANEWVSQFNQIEIVEQSVMSLFSKLPYAKSLSLEWIISENIWTQISGFILIARIVEDLSKTQLNIIIEKALELSSTSNYHLYKAIGLCLSRFCRKDGETAKLIEKELAKNTDRSSVGQKYIAMEVNQEILFLDYK